MRGEELVTHLLFLYRYRRLLLTILAIVAKLRKVFR